MAITLTGLASGLDTETIISQLMAIEQNKVTAVQRRQVAVTQHRTDLAAIKTKLDAVKSAAADLTAATTWKPVQTTTSSDPTKVDVTVLSGAGIGGHSFQVERLASSAQHGYAYTPSETAGELTFTTAAGATTIQVAAGATASELAATINASQAAPVYAAVVKNGSEERIVFSARTTGESSDFGVSGDTLVEDAAYARTGAALNASYYLDGESVARSSESNIVENAIPGVRVTLKGVTTSPVSVVTTQPAIDADAITKKITALVDAYNAVVTATRSELTEKRVPTATTSADIQKGQLFGDTGLNAMLGGLKNVLTKSGLGLALDGLAEIGIGVPKATGGATSQDAKDGKLTIDGEQLAAAIANDYTKVRELFAGQGTTKGVSALVSDFVSSQTGTDGALTNRMSSDDARLKGYDAQIAKLNERMEAEQARLRTQFAAMETALNNSQTQQAWLTSQIATLPLYG